jgi:hypothetical protein
VPLCSYFIASAPLFYLHIHALEQREKLRRAHHTLGTLTARAQPRKPTPLQALAPDPVTAWLETEHLDLRPESNNIPHTDCNLSLLSIDGIRCMVSD